MPVLFGLLSGLVGLALGGGGAAAVRALSGRPAFDGATELILVFSYIGALIGWVLGIGGWRYAVRDWIGRAPRPFNKTGTARYFAFSTDHKVIGIQYIVTFIGLMILGGLLAMLMRFELSQVDETIMGSDIYNRVMSLHGIIMVAVAVATVLGGLGNFAVPLMIGAKDMAFPRLNALSFWLNPPVAIALLSSWFFGGWDTGWTAYAPLSETNASGQVLFILAVFTFGVSSILGGLNFIATITTMRSPGMTWGRLPIFVWSIFAASIISLLFTQFFAASLVMILLDRVAGMGFFNPDQGGDPLLYQHVFWFYSHPAVYVMILPGFGITLEILSHFSRKPVFAYRWAVASMLSIVFMGAIVWAHHMFTTGMADYLHGPFMGLTELVSIPTGIIFLAALGTIWQGKLWMKTPMLFALAFIFNFLFGGITGIYNADVTTDIHLQDSYWVVAHFHYTIVGGEIFALMAGIYYWFPKMTGRMYDELLANLHFWGMFIGFNVTFGAMFWLGVNGMNRRVADYEPHLEGNNLFVSAAGFYLGMSFLIFLYNMWISSRHGPQVVDNPWRARTLEWTVSSPPSEHNFPVPPLVVGHPHDYGIPGEKHAVFAATGGAPMPSEQEIHSEGDRS